MPVYVGYLMRRRLVKGAVVVLLPLSLIAMASNYGKIDTVLGRRVAAAFVVVCGPVVAWY